MPVIQIQVSDETSRDTMKRIRKRVRQAVLDTLAPKETGCDYVTICGVVAETGDGVPLIQIDLRPGREQARKRALIDAISRILSDEIDVAAEDLYVLFREFEARHHYKGATQLRDWIPVNDLYEVETKEGLINPSSCLLKLSNTH